MTPILIDTTVLSNFAAIHRLDLLHQLFGEVTIAYSVFEELQSGVDEGYSFLSGIESFIHPFHPNGWIRLITLDDATEFALYDSMPPKLHRGEAMLLAIAAHRKWRLLTDDKAARKYGAKLGVSISSTLGVLLLLVKNGHIDIEAANTYLRQMVELATYRSPVSDLRDLMKE